MEQRRRRRRTVLVLLTGVIVIGVIAGLVFQPWRLFVDTEVRDADPFVAAAAGTGVTVAPTTTTTTGAPAASPSDAPAVTSPSPPTTAPPTTAPPTNAPSTTAPPTTAPALIRVGSFRSIAHQTSGNVRVGPTPDGRQVVYLEDLATDNGPDVRVFLSPHPPEGDDSIYGTDELELGPLKGNIGDQTYEVPAGIDLSRYQSVVLWCERFSVGFGVAGLTPA